jgi:hypothetical protein
MKVQLYDEDEKYLYFQVRVPKRQLKVTEVVKLTDVVGRLIYGPLASYKDKKLTGKSP